MHHGSGLAGLELITALSYLMILVGFVLRNALEQGTPRLLWPWMLVSIFGLCGITRLDYSGIFAPPEWQFLLTHGALTALAFTYGLGQILYAFVPELFDEEAPLPKIVEEIEA